MRVRDRETSVAGHRSPKTGRWRLLIASFGVAAIAVSVLPGLAVAAPVPLAPIDVAAPSGPEPAGGPVPAPLSNIPYGQFPQQRLDAYVPPAVAPAVVVIHGGGWTGRDKTSPQIRPIAEMLAQDGFAVFNINFRLASETVSGVPMQTDDIALAVDWVVRNGANYGADPRRINLIGGSSGAQLAALAGQLINQEHPGRVDSVVVLSGPLDFVLVNEPIDEPPPRDDERPGVNAYLGCVPSKCTPEQLQRPSPFYNIDAATCPAFMLVNAEEEIIPVEQPQAMHARLVLNGCSSDLRILPGVEHGFKLFDDLEPDIMRFFGLTPGNEPMIGGVAYIGKVGEPYTFAYTTHGPGPVTVEVSSGALPPGMALSPVGVLSGTPTQSGTFPFNLRATNAFGFDESAFGMEIRAAATISGTPPEAEVGQSYSFAFTVGGDAEVTVSLTGGSLPPGLSLAADGTMSGTPSQSGSFPFRVKAENTTGSAELVTSITVRPAPAGISITRLEASVSPVQTGAPVTLTATVSGPVTPTGTVVFTEGGTTLGTKQVNAQGRAAVTTSFAAGVHQVVATYSGNAQMPGSTSTSVDVVVVDAVTVGAELPSGRVGTPYSAVVPHAGGGPVTFRLASGTLPLGLTLAEDGKVEGKPRVGGITTFQVTATNPVSSVTQSVSVSIERALTTSVMTSSANPSTAGAPVSFTVVISTDTTIKKPTGTVQFRVDGRKFGKPVRVTNGQAVSPPVSGLALGSHKIAATYGGDASFTGSNSQMTQIVQQAQGAAGLRIPS